MSIGKLYKPSASQSGQSSGAQPKVEKGNASSGAAYYAQQLIKKLKGPDGGRWIIKTELQKYLNEGLEEDEVGKICWDGGKYMVLDIS